MQASKRPHNLGIVVHGLGSRRQLWRVHHIPQPLHLRCHLLQAGCSTCSCFSWWCRNHGCQYHLLDCRWAALPSFEVSTSWQLRIAGAWLGVLRLLAMWLPQPAVITTGGDLERTQGQDRIAFLAAVRNAALAPLWQVRTAASSCCSRHISSPECVEGQECIEARDSITYLAAVHRCLHMLASHRSRRAVWQVSASVCYSSCGCHNHFGAGLTSWGRTSPRWRAAWQRKTTSINDTSVILPLQDKPWPADRVVFLNDVYFCTADVVRLLSHESAHLACGMDFDRPRIDQMDPPVSC